MYLVMCNVIVIENLVDGILDLILINQAVEQDNAILRQAGYGIPQRLFDEEVISHVGCCAADICVLDCDFLCHTIIIEQILDVHLDHKAAAETGLTNA